MPDSSASAVMLLPFGSLTGVIPIDAVPQRRVLGDFSGVLGGSDSRLAEPVGGDPFGTAVPANIGEGRDRPWK
jgi:hypothetical protein